jgi:hypothetical protein
MSGAHSGNETDATWNVETTNGRLAVWVAVAHTDYSRLALTLESEIIVPVVPLWVDLLSDQLAFLVPAELVPWMEATLVTCCSLEDRTLETSDGFSVAAAALVVDVGCMPAFSPAGPEVSWTRRGLWPHGAAAREVPCNAGRGHLPDEFEAVAPSAISCSPDEVDVLLLGALYTGPWGWWLKDLRWPLAEPDQEAGAGTGEEEPHAELLASGTEGGDAQQDVGNFLGESWDWTAADVAVPNGETDEELDAPFFSAAPLPVSVKAQVVVREEAPATGKKKKEKAPPKAKQAQPRGPKKQEQAPQQQLFSGLIAKDQGGDMREVVKLMTMMQSEMKNVAGHFTRRRRAVRQRRELQPLLRSRARCQACLCTLQDEPHRLLPATDEPRAEVQSRCQDQLWSR